MEIKFVHFEFLLFLEIIFQIAQLFLRLRHNRVDRRPLVVSHQQQNAIRTISMMSIKNF